jgi:hypothetical protein
MSRASGARRRLNARLKGIAGEWRDAMIWRKQIHEVIGEKK